MNITLSWACADGRIDQRTYQRPQYAYAYVTKHPDTTIWRDGRRISVIELGRIVEATLRLARERR